MASVGAPFSRSAFIVVLRLYLLHITAGYVNVSVNKSADMSSSQYSNRWLADEAVDGDVSQKVEQDSCAVTSDNFHKQAWWRVDLGAVHVINSVKIYYRKEGENQSLTNWLSGFSIYVADTLNWWIGTRCYLHNNGEHTNPGPSDIFTVPCNATGHYVTVYKQRNTSCVWSYPKVFCAKLDLCEVQILSCENGTYGKTCSHNCSGNCLNCVHCDKAHGGCDGGCAPGYRGFYCNDECNDGFFGFNCSHECGKCKTGKCDRKTGICVNGCDPGWKGNYCNETCPHGTYGENCNYNCSVRCKDKTKCRKYDGFCQNCSAGWMGHFCDKSCPDGRYGINCIGSCSAICRNILKCRKTDGFCEICSNGWKGRFCDEKCTAGTFGSNCSSVCGNCFGVTCNHVDGSCPAGCVPGWKGIDCNETCNYGWYGKQCVHTCKSCAETCHHVTGRCLVFEKQTPEEITINILVAVVVTFGVAITVLNVALLITCLRLRNLSLPNITDVSGSNTTRGEQGRVELSDMNINPNDTVNEVRLESVPQTDNRKTYEDLVLATPDPNTYESLQPSREVAYTNT